VSASRSRARALELPPEMNVTPLVDVVLVLLIIFMVVAPRLNQDIQVDLPGIFNPDPEVKSMDPVKISMPAKGEFWLNEQRYDLDGLLQALQLERDADPTRRLVLRGDQKLKYGDVRELLARTQGIGFPGLSFMVGEKHREGGGPRAMPSTETNATAPEAPTPAAAPTAPADAEAPPPAAAEG
jgi:biopolymer transport protein TolR